MIRVKSPSMSIMASDAAVSYQMDHFIIVGPAASMNQLASKVVERAMVIGQRIDNLILAAHGGPGHFAIGAGLNINTMEPFRILQNQVNRIWFRGCLVGRIINSQTPSHGDWAALSAFGLNSGNGHAFLSAFARLTQCHVVASTEFQTSRLQTYPSGLMDDFEGLVVKYSPQGQLISSYRNASVFAINPTTRRASSPNQE